MVDDQSLIRLEQIERSILFIRGQKVMIDSDLAKLYGTTTKKLNQAIKRNRARFPSDFMFQLTLGEKQEVVTDCDHLKGLRFSPVLPNVFTEHGAIMAASILNSLCAIEASVFVVRAFIRQRRILAAHKDLAQKLESLEDKYDAQFKVVFDAIRQLMASPRTKRRRIGFGARNL